MEKINGIIINGKVYEIEPGCQICHQCALYGSICGHCCNMFGGGAILRYSHELTEKLNNPKTKEK